MATINTRTYSFDGSTGDSARYVGPAHTFSTLDTFELGRVYPKPGRNGDMGVARPAVKRVLSVVVNSTTGERKNAITSISGSLPVGMSAADIDALCADLAAFIGSTDGKNLFKSLDINL